MSHLHRFPETAPPNVPSASRLLHLDSARTRRPCPDRGSTWPEYNFRHLTSPATRSTLRITYRGFPEAAIRALPEVSWPRRDEGDESDDRHSAAADQAIGRGSALPDFGAADL